MPWDKDDPLYISGIVSPEEWDWEAGGMAMAKKFWKDPFSYVKMDVWKYLGLLRRLEVCERIIAEVVKKEE